MGKHDKPPTPPTPPPPPPGNADGKSDGVSSPGSGKHGKDPGKR